MIRDRPKTSETVFFWLKNIGLHEKFVRCRPGNSVDSGKFTGATSGQLSRFPIELPPIFLTALKVKNARPAAKIRRLFDGAGLYLEISPKGGKWWR
jgi:hypothetical protein